MGYNRSGNRRKARLRRRRREVTRLVNNCESANVRAKEQGGQVTDYSKEIRRFRKLMKFRS